MGKLIDEQAAYDVLTDYYHHTTDIQHAALREALGRVESVDAVPVVRCKDCLHNRACEIQYHAQAGDLFFCGAAERKGCEQHEGRFNKQTSGVGFDRQTAQCM